MNIPRMYRFAWILAAAFILSSPPWVLAEGQPSSNLLLPWFEVDLEGGTHTTLFALANSSAEPVDVLVSVQTNWGIPVLSSRLTIAGGRIETVDLRDWLVFGRTPSGALGSGELSHVQSALSGRPSPRDGLYYASPPAVPGRAVGAVTFRAQGTHRPRALWGDFILSDSARGSAHAQSLLDLDLTVPPRPDCSRHGVRFLAGNREEMASELWLWTRRQGEPSTTPEPVEASRVHGTAEVFDEAGRRLVTHSLELKPVARIALSDLVGNEPFGWLDLTTGADSFAGVAVTDGAGMVMVLPAVCLPGRPGPGLRLDILANGQETSIPPGPSVPVGKTIDWRYIVTNTGDAPLSGILVNDFRGTGVACPGSVLAPGESMTCTGMSTALACQQESSAQVTAQTPAGEVVEAGGFARYFGGTYGRGASIDLEVSIAGEDADVPPGPTVEAFPAAVPAYLKYVVRNTGSLPLSGLSVSGEGGRTPYFSRDTLAPGASMMSYLEKWPELGLNHDLSKASGMAPCGLTAEDEDPTYYVGVEPQRPARIEIEALLDGLDADVAPGPSLLAGYGWVRTYVVVNTGEIYLFDIFVMENGERAYCPETPLNHGLGPGESMTCTSFFNILPGWQQTEATVHGYFRPRYGTCPLDSDLPQCRSVSDSDLSYYFGASVRVNLELLVNGEIVDSPPGPEIPVGSPVEWTYRVTNWGNVDLTSVTVMDEQGNPLEGCRFSLSPGSSKSCSEMSTAVAGPQRRSAQVIGRVSEWDDIDMETAFYTGVPPSL